MRKKGSFMRSGWKRFFTGKQLYSIFIPALLWGDLDSSAAETRRVYRPTAAQLRLEQQNRERAKRIQAIRRQQAQQPPRNGTAVSPAARPAPAVSAPAAGKNPPPAVKNAPAPAAPHIRYIWHQSSRFLLVQDIARYYGMKIYYLKNGV